MTTPSEKTTPHPEMSSQLQQQGKLHCEAMLKQFPALKSVAIVFDYENPAEAKVTGMWCPRRPLDLCEMSDMFAAFDTFMLQARRHHRDLISKLFQTEKDANG